MPRKRLPRVPGTENATSRLSDGQPGRLAELVADGHCQSFEDLEPADQQRLQEEVRDCLRERLVRLVARAIAQQLHRDARHR